MITRRFQNFIGTEFYRLQEAYSEKKVFGRFLRKKFFPSKTLSIKVKAIVQSDVNIDNTLAPLI